MIPPKLKRGDRVAVVSPSRSLSIISVQVRKNAQAKLGELGLGVVYSKNAEESDEFDSSSIESRVADLRWAFEAKEINAIFTCIGGFNSNQLLASLDYSRINSNPKILCGYSDITALQNAIYAKTGLVTYSGPHFSSFGMLKGIEYTVDYLKKCLFDARAFEVVPSPLWSDDRWYIDQEKREFARNEGHLAINQGSAEGTILGGNLCTFNLLQGTEFMPDLGGSVLFLEDDSETKPHTFDRDLQSLIHQPGFDEVKGLVIGRFQKESGLPPDLVAKIVKRKKELARIPVIAGVDFGHTTPQITFPIGGTARLVAEKNRAELEILEH